MKFWRHAELRGTRRRNVLAALVLMALLAPWFAPGDPLAIAGEPMLRPFASGSHLLGTDRLGRDVLVGLLYGARTTLLVAFFSAAVALVIGSVVGTLAGFSAALSIRC